MKRATAKIRRSKAKPSSPTTVEVQRYKPQPGPQQQYLECKADICIFGGSAGGGKTFGSLLELLRFRHLKGFRALVLRRQLVDITQTGGIWSDAEGLFPEFGGKANNNRHYFKFPGKNGKGKGAHIGFNHMQDAKAGHKRYKSAQLALILFEELTEFMSHQFWYMLSRNRTACGVNPYIRATTNPEPGWVADLLMDGGYVCRKSGLAIPEMSGVIRLIIRDKNIVHWFDTLEQVREKFPDEKRYKPLSFTFIRSTLEDNKKLLENDPDYEAKMLALDDVERQRLLEGNWKIKPAAGLLFKREWWQYAHALPAGGFRRMRRSWDFAASKKKTADYTVGALLGETAEKTWYILDIKRFRGTPAEVRTRVKATADADAETWGKRVRTTIPHDPAQAGTDQVDSYLALLAGHRVDTIKPTGDKVTRAGGLSSQVQHGRVFLLVNTEAPPEWLEEFLNEFEAFPDGEHDDQVDAVVDAFNSCAQKTNSFGR